MNISVSAILLNCVIVPTIAITPVPDWYKYDSTDSDQDGIPDLWERWTHGNPFLADSLLDRDGDGLTDLYEFWHQTDPCTADTDGDGLSDAYEVEMGLNPLVKESFSIDEPDANTNGIPDWWEDCGYPYGYSDINGDGFDDATYAAVPAPADWNFDVCALVTSSRSALLRWGYGTGEGLVLPPCTNLAISLRLDARTENHLTLLPTPTNTPATGLWQGRLLLDWHAVRPQETELARVRAGDGTIVEFYPVNASSFTGLLNNPPGGGQGGHTLNGVSSFGDFPTWIFEKPLLTLMSYTPQRCRLHGPLLVVTALTSQVTMPLCWTVAGSSLQVYTNNNFVPQTHGFNTDNITITARQNTTAYSTIIVSDTATFTAGQCPSAETNIVGAAWSSSHDPDDAADHLPGVDTNIAIYAVNCPPATNLTYRLGFAHTDPVKTRNLVRIETGDPRDDETDHCLGVVWSEGGTLDLKALLDPVCNPHLDSLSFLVNGTVNRSGVLAYGKEPYDLAPKIFHVELRHADVHGTLDRLWITLNSRKTQRNFNNRYSLYSTNLNWVASLHKPYASLIYSTNANGVVSAADPEPDEPEHWEKPKSTKGELLHHNAKFGMRSVAVSGGHGNQACYDATGQLIIQGIAGGTADWRVGNMMNYKTHVREDVEPFLRAVWLDGNPGNKTTLNNLTRPCLFEGEAIDRYIQCRPITQP